jgi:hypothetical protein
LENGYLGDRGEDERLTLGRIYADGMRVREVFATGSGSVSMAGFAISGVETYSSGRIN